MKRQIVWMVFVVVVLAATLCFFYVKPGVWRYRYESYGPEGRRYMLRTDKLTGQVFRYAPSKSQWMVYTDASVLWKP